MNDDRTEEQKLLALKNAIDVVRQNGWTHISGWFFQSPAKTTHDLSCADLSMLDCIERNRTFIVQNPLT